MDTESMTVPRAESQLTSVMFEERDRAHIVGVKGAFLNYANILQHWALLMGQRCRLSHE